MLRQRPDRSVKVLMVGNLSFVLSGCFLGMYFPSSVDVELSHRSPLRGAASDMRTLMIAYPLTSESLIGLTDSSRGKLEPLALEIAEQLQQSGRFTLLSLEEYRVALAGSRTAGFRPSSVLTDADKRELILAGAREAKADGVILFQGKWEGTVSLGKPSFGRPEYERQLAMTLIATKTGETIWRQEAAVTIHEGLTLPTEEEIRAPVVSRLARNFLETIQ